MKYYFILYIESKFAISNYCIIWFFSDNIEDEQRRLLLMVLQRLIHAVDTLAFPLPQGFPSFITYLGYKVMSATMFSQYVRCNTFSLNVDVMKKILAGK